MPELRKDPIIGRWVIISLERKAKAHRLSRRGPEAQGRFLSVLHGQRIHDPAGGPRLPGRRLSPNGPGWKLRVVPNKFPALQVEGMLNKMGEGIYDKMNGIGAHEVIIETPITTRRSRPCRSSGSRTPCGPTATGSRT